LGGNKVANDKNTDGGHKKRYRRQRVDMISDVPD
jgi:hypothetical protein